MTTVYLVKSFGFEGYTNLKVFASEDRAQHYADKLQQQIDDMDGIEDEWIEVESFTLEG